MSGEDEHPATECDSAGSKLRGTTATRGVIARMAVNKHPLDENGCHIAAASTVASMGRGRRKSVVSLPISGHTALPAFGRATKASLVSFSVQAPRETIERLEKHNKLLEQELLIEARAARERLGIEKRSRVEQIHSTLALYTRKLAKAQRQVKRTEHLMQQKTQELTALRLVLQPISVHEALAESNNGMPSKAHAAAAAAPGTLRTAENRLELALVRKNEVDSANKHLRARIDDARRDRLIFDEIYRKLERETSGFKARQEQVQAELAQATQARDALAREVNGLQEAAEREQTAYETQFQELKRDIELWRKKAGVGMAASELKNSPLSCIFNGRARLNAEVTANSIPRSSGVDLTLSSTPDSTYEQAAATIHERTGLQNTETVAQDLLARDTANFQRFKLVEELSREEGFLQAQAATLACQIKTYEAQEGITNQASQKQQRRRVKALLGKTQQACDELDAEIEERDADLTKIKASVHAVYNMMAHATACVSASGKRTALDHGITNTNVFKYLQAIERYTTTLLQKKASDEARETLHERNQGQLQPQAQTTSAFSASLLPVGHGPLTLPSDPSQRLHVHVPSFGGVDGFIEFPAQVLSPSLDTRKCMATLLPQRLDSSMTKQHHETHCRSTRHPWPLRGALPFNEATASYERVGKKTTLGTAKRGLAAREDLQDDKEEERVLTYDELKRFAEMHTKSQRRGNT